MFQFAKTCYNSVMKSDEASLREQIKQAEEMLLPCVGDNGRMDAAWIVDRVVRALRILAAEESSGAESGPFTSPA
jgi:hypothetical protein